jgi:hypothetical protein
MFSERTFRDKLATAKDAPDLVTLFNAWTPST